MFYYYRHLLARKAPHGKIWMAATMHAKIHRGKLDELNIVKKCEENWIPMARRFSGILKDNFTGMPPVEIKQAWKVEGAPSDPTRLLGKTQTKFLRRSDVGLMKLTSFHRQFSTDPSKSEVVRVICDGSYRWTERIGGRAFWLQRGTQFLEARMAREVGDEYLLNTDMSEFNAIGDAIEVGAGESNMIIVTGDSMTVLNRLKYCLENRSLPRIPEKKKKEADLAFRRRMATHSTIADVLKRIPVGCYIKVEYIVGTENILSDLLARLSLHFDKNHKPRYTTVAEIREEYETVRTIVDTEVAGLCPKNDKKKIDGIEKGLPKLRGEDWDILTEKMKSPEVSTVADFILWKGLEN